MQFAPDLFPTLRREADRNPVPGRFLLTESAHVFMLPRAAESLDGRREVLTLDPLSQSEIGGSPHTPTLRRYLSLLEALFIVQPLPAWSIKLGKRLVKAPKLHSIDADLTAHLRGQADAEALALSPQLGPLLETFVVHELRRHLRCADTAATAWHFCTAAGYEVDLVLETPDQRVVGIAIKASASLKQGDFEGLRELRRAAGRAFTRSVVLYTGEQLLPFEDDLWAVPMGALWAGGAAV